jgi:hypothetical protein
MIRWYQIFITHQAHGQHDTMGGLLYKMHHSKNLCRFFKSPTGQSTCTITDGNETTAIYAVHGRTSMVSYGINRTIYRTVSWWHRSLTVRPYGRWCAARCAALPSALAGLRAPTATFPISPSRTQRPCTLLGLVVFMPSLFLIFGYFCLLRRDITSGDPILSWMIIWPRLHSISTGQPLRLSLRLSLAISNQKNLITKMIC